MAIMEDIEENVTGRSFTAKDMLGVMQYETWKDDLVEKDLCAFNGMV